MPNVPRCLCALAAALTASAHGVPAQHDPAAEPAQLSESRRRIAVYDFEEPANPFDVPAEFFRAQSDPDRGLERPGYPVFNLAAFDDTHARSGERSVRLPVRRGSVSLRLRPGAVAVFADADYTVSCHVRAEGLTYARFRLVARMLDEAGLPIDGAEWATPPVLPGAEWQPLFIEIMGGLSDRAAFLQIDAEVVQPAIFTPPSLGTHQVWPEDFAGAAWIDDIEVRQLPRVVLAPAAQGGVIAHPDTPVLSLLVRDLTGEQLQAELTVRDIDGAVVHTRTGRIGSSSVPSRWEAPVPRLGWYSAEAVVMASSEMVGRASCAFIVLPPTPARSDAEGGYDPADIGRFALADEAPSPALLEAIPYIGRATDTSGLVLGVWAPAVTPEATGRITDAIAPVVRSREHTWHQPMLAVPIVPDAILARIVADPEAVIDVLAADRALWAGSLEPVLDAMGQLVRRWRLGPIGAAPAFDSGTLDEQLASIRADFALLVPGPELEITWTPGRSFDSLSSPRDLAGVAVHLPAGRGAGQAADVVSRWAESSLAGSARLTLSLGVQSDMPLDRRAISAELVRRIIEAEAARAEAQTPISLAYEINTPWRELDRADAVIPEPALAAWRSTIDRLRGRRVAASLAFVPGTRVYLLVPEDPRSRIGGALVAWNESAPADEAAVELNLGEEPVTAVDLWGNRSQPIAPIAIELGSGLDIEVHRIPLTTEPVFIEGIDAEQALFIASIRLDQPVLQATPGPHRRDLSITNPWPYAIEGDAIVLEPLARLPNGRATGWEISPRVRRFTIPPNQTIAIPIEFSFSTVEPSGRKPLVVDVALTASRDARRLRAISTIELALDGLELDVRPRAQPAGIDAEVEVVVTNTSAEPADLTLTATARGYPKQSATVHGVPPGGSVVRRFIYPGGVERLRGESVFVGLEDPSRRGRLNKEARFDARALSTQNE
jgi:hypothetical protein